MTMEELANALESLGFRTPAVRGTFIRVVEEIIRGVESQTVAINKQSVSGVEPVKIPVGSSTVTHLPETGFKFSERSRKELEGVHPALVECVRLALTRYTTVDFMVFDGLRTKEEQRNHVKNGTSRTMNSMHLRQESGYGHAVDLVPIIGGVPKWDWDGCAAIAYAMDLAATQLGIADKITWGGAWDRTLADYGGDSQAYMAEVEAYKRRHPGPDFIDGPHFQLRV